MVEPILFIAIGRAINGHSCEEILTREFNVLEVCVVGDVEVRVSVCESDLGLVIVVEVHAVVVEFLPVCEEAVVIDEEGRDVVAVQGSELVFDVVRAWHCLPEVTDVRPLLLRCWIQLRVRNISTQDGYSVIYHVLCIICELNRLVEAINVVMDAFE